MSFTALTALIPPPSRPLYSDGDWDAVVQEIETPLPEDYKELVRVYGAGSFTDFIYLITPFVPDKYLNIVRNSRETQRLRKCNIGEEPPFSFPVFPEKNGVLQFGSSTNGDFLFWSASDPDPNRWTTRIYNARDGDGEDFAMGVVDLIYGILSKKIASRMFPDDFPPRKTSEFFKFYPFGQEPREEETIIS